MAAYVYIYARVDRRPEETKATTNTIRVVSCCTCGGATVDTCEWLVGRSRRPDRSGASRRRRRSSGWLAGREANGHPARGAVRTGRSIARTLRAAARMCDVTCVIMSAG